MVAMAMRWAWAAGALCVVVGCRAEHHAPTPVAGSSDAGSSGNAGAGGGGGGGGRAGASASGDGGVAVGGYRVTIDATATRICAGECVQLIAQAEQGNPPYAYAWSHELGDGPGPHEVCPAQTTSYSVTASDTAIDDEEFDRPSATASATRAIEVDDDGDCGVAPRPDAGAPEPSGTTELCSVRVPYAAPNWFSALSGWEGNSSLGVDDEGNVYVAGVMQGTIVAGHRTVTATSGHDSLVLKYDASCQLVWAKHLAGSSDGGVGIAALAVGRDGQLVVVGTITGTADFGAGAVSSGLATSGLVVTLAADDGSVLWNEVYGSVLSGAAIWDVGIDDAGDIVISGNAPPDASFGGEPIGGGGSTHAFVAKLSSAGAHRYSFAILDTDVVAPVAVHGSGAVAVAGWAMGSSIDVNGTAIPLTGAVTTRYVALLEPSGEVGWGHELMFESSPSSSGIWGGSVAIDADRAVVLEHGWDDGDTSDGGLSASRTISKLAADGTVLWAVPTRRGSQHIGGFQYGGLAVDPHRNVLHADEIDDPDSLVAGAPSNDVVPRNRLSVRKLTAGGQPVWSHQLGQSDLQWTWGIAAAPDDSVWVAFGEEKHSTSGTSGALVITKLAP